jgi:calpain-15
MWDKNAALEKLNKIIADCDGKPYVDQDFPASMESLINAKNKASNNEQDDIDCEWDDIVWKRPNDLEDLNKGQELIKLFEGKIEPSDIKQGSIGNCYFLSVLGALAEFEDRIRQLFVNTEANKEGVYGIIMTKNGEKQMIVVDDLIPSMDNETVFSHANGPELWVILLEKAWAKLHGSYERIIGGISY